MNYLDKALNGVLDNLERNVVDQVREAAAALEEYPTKVENSDMISPADWEIAPQVLSYWKQFNLEDHKRRFQEHLQHIAAERASKDKSVPSLIRRADQAENALSSICQELLQAPDVAPFLNDALTLHTRQQDLQKEILKLQKDCQAAEKEAVDAGSTINQMKKAKEELSQVSVKLEEEIAKTLELRTKLASTDELRDQCAKLRTEVSQLRSTLATVQAEHETAQSELFELRSGREALHSTQAHEAEHIAQEHEQALAEIRQLEGKLKRQETKHEELLAQGRDTDTSGIASSRETFLQQEVIRLQSEMMRLHQADQSREDAEIMAHTLQLAEQELITLKAELSNCVPVREAEELKSRLESAETLLEAQVAGNSTSGQGLGPGRFGRGQHTEALVSVLQGRNRSLAAENGVLRQECDQANQAVDSLRQDLAAARGQSDRQEVLIKQLEQDLISSCEHGSADRPHADNPSPAVKDQARAAEEGSDREGSVDGILQIVTKQRNRFRQRVIEAEQQLGEARQDLGAAHGRVARLEQDNVGLFERIRFLQQYQPERSTSGGTSLRQQGADISHRMSCGPFQVQVGGGARSRGKSARFSCLGGRAADEEAGVPRSELEQRYAKVYELKLNPFTDFQNNEREERLPSHERALLAGSKLILSNRPGRVFIVIYLVALHVFLFCLLYKIMISSATRYLGHTNINAQASST